MPVDKHPDRARVRILTVHPAKRKVEAGFRDGGTIEVPIIETGPFFKWPQQDELWTVQRRNHAWYLESQIEPAHTNFPIEDLSAGEAKIYATTIYDTQGNQLATLDDIVGGGSDVLEALAALDPTTANTIPLFTGPGPTAAIPLAVSPFVQTILDETTNTAFRTAIGAGTSNVALPIAESDVSGLPGDLTARELTANKDATTTLVTDDATHYPTTHAVRAYVAAATPPATPFISQAKWLTD